MDNSGSFLRRRSGKLGKKSSLIHEETPYHAINSDNLDENFEIVVWERILEKLNEKFNPQVFFWFTSLKLISQDDKSITLEAKSIILGIK